MLLLLRVFNFRLILISQLKYLECKLLYNFIFKTVEKQKGSHTEQKKGTRQPNSISKITFRAINVNGLGDKKRESVLKKNKP